MIENVLRKYQDGFHAVVPFDPATDKIVQLDLTALNRSLSDEIVNDTDKFADYVNRLLDTARATYAIGGYNELRAIYNRSAVFDGTAGEPRRLHLGIDIWGKAGTPVFAPLGGMVHSFAFNDRFGDYGATLILLHQLDGQPFHTLYGHISLKDIEPLTEGSYVNIGQEIAHFGSPAENGHWPPHLHFQVIQDMELKKGDYIGVCRYSERDRYLQNCPDPDLVLQMLRYAV